MCAKTAYTFFVYSYENIKQYAYHLKLAKDLRLLFNIKQQSNMGDGRSVVLRRMK